MTFVNHADQKGCSFMMRSACLVLCAAAIGLVAAPSVSLAQEVTIAEIVGGLTPPPAPTRGIKRDNSGTVLEGLPSVSLVVGFEGNTHRLTVEGMKALRTLAAALNGPGFEGEQFQIAAHAFLPSDPVSSQPVSSRRAQVVAEHLAGFYGIDPTRMRVVGLGATAMHDAGNPADPLNQRIEVTNLGSGQ